MVRGRAGLDPEMVKSSLIVRWADEGEKWLDEQFKGRNLLFHTKWSTEDVTITLEVFRESWSKHKSSRRDGPDRTVDFLFRETCAAKNFVNRLMVTKIMMVM